MSPHSRIDGASRTPWKAQPYPNITGSGKFDHALNSQTLEKISDHQLDLTAGMEYWKTCDRCDIPKRMTGLIEFIKLTKESTLPTYRYTNREDLRVYSFYGNAKYKSEQMAVHAAVSAKWNAKNQFLQLRMTGFNELSIKADGEESENC
ncbi:hypothetical protein FQR65_LT18949 [Abscondita terminalis]|nr:hypothetical protein FQR65_LT18949 [Abscondita terminalis]